MDKFYILIASPSGNSDIDVFIKSSIDEVIDELYRIDVGLFKDQIRLMLRRIIQNSITYYTNEAKIHFKGSLGF